jgi:hypothetical protein
MKFNKRIIEPEELVKAYVEAEARIGDVTYQNR